MPGVVEMIRLGGGDGGDDSKRSGTEASIERRCAQEAVSKGSTLSAEGKRQQLRFRDGGQDLPGTSGPGAGGRQSREAEQFQRLLHAARRRRTGNFAAALHYGRKLGRNERLFRVSTAVPAEEGGVHDAFESESESDSDGHDGPSKAGDRAGHKGSPAERRRRPPKPTHFRFMMYNNARLAWWPQAYARPYLAVVDDLRSGERRKYEFPRHGREQAGYTTAMSSRLLLMGKRNLLHAWHFGTDRIQTAEFPLDIERVFVEADRLLAVAQSTGDVYYWRYGEEWRAVDMQLLKGCYARGRVRASGLVELPPTSPPHRIGLRLCEDGMLLDFILHPAVASRFFVVTFSTAYELRVYEVDLSQSGGGDAGGDGDGGARAGAVVGVYTPRNEDMSVFRDLPDHHGYLRWEKIDSHGGYCLMMLNGEETRWARHREGGGLIDPEESTIDSNDDPGEGDHMSRQQCTQLDAPYTVVAVCFNIYTKKFDFVVYHPPWQFAGQSWHIWNGLLYTPDGRTGRDVIIASRRCTSGRRHGEVAERGGGMAQTVARVPCYTTTALDLGTQVDRNASNRQATDISSMNQPAITRRSHSVLTDTDIQHALVDSALPGSDAILAHIDHVLDPHQKYSPSQSLACPAAAEALARSPDGRQTPHYQVGNQRILGDEGSLMFVDDQDYTVWSFSGDFAPRWAGSGEDEGDDVKSSGLGTMRLPWHKKKKKA
ncbi:hypothetical protein Micbo1qcDRAFT_166873 [Microdochium bolleyi]|uniref:Uncharacterized protein n=1 Tax=Microdochium bolleyi TaxID=196109 RepID=A0A136ITD7_9PEZI|nr:hypothetical protein Micbo1qcDRAFT_166873 [Microdochium bolleyi]